MHRNPREILIAKLTRSLSVHGEVTRFCKVTGLFRSGVDRWLTDGSSPSLESLDQIAKYYNCEPWELIKPEGVGVTLREALAVLTEAIVLAEKQQKLVSGSPELIARIAAFDDSQLELLERAIAAIERKGGTNPPVMDEGQQSGNSA